MLYTVLVSGSVFFPLFIAQGEPTAAEMAEGKAVSPLIATEVRPGSVRPPAYSVTPISSAPEPDDVLLYQAREAEEPVDNAAILETEQVLAEQGFTTDEILPGSLNAAPTEATEEAPRETESSGVKIY